MFAILCLDQTELLLLQAGACKNINDEGWNLRRTGPLKQIFNLRMIKELKINNHDWELLKYRFHLLFKDRGGLFFWIPISMLCLIFGDYTSEKELNSLYITVFLGILIYQSIRLYRGIAKYYR